LRISSPRCFPKMPNRCRTTTQVDPKSTQYRAVRRSPSEPPRNA